MDPRDVIRKVGTGDVEIGMRPLKRMVVDSQGGWVCERCGDSRPAGEAKDTSGCKSKTGKHKWRRA
ncbi:MAG: hypothetical protein QOJ65_1864 [Fimbriimonadaceae bacterium]|jgi:hypothetical protein|nr:hypothetical protein [Fimbriimonadaceae bacterium]